MIRKLGAEAQVKVYQSLVFSFKLKNMSQLGTELIPHGITEKGISITLMYSKTSKQILFVEAGKDFVDLVVGFLTLPIGCVIKVLSESEHFLKDPTKCHFDSSFLPVLGLHSHGHHVCTSETLSEREPAFSQAQQI